MGKGTAKFIKSSENFLEKVAARIDDESENVLDMDKKEILLLLEMVKSGVGSAKSMMEQNKKSKGEDDNELNGKSLADRMSNTSN